MTAQRWMEGGFFFHEVTSSHSYSHWLFFYIPKILWVPLRLELGHPTKRRHLDFNPQRWHGWTASAWIRMDVGLLRCSSPSWPFLWKKSQLPRLWYFLLSVLFWWHMHSCFLQSLGNTVGCSEWGGFREEDIYHNETGERIKRKLWSSLKNHVKGCHQNLCACRSKGSGRQPCGAVYLRDLGAAIS